MSANFAKTLVWKHGNGVKLWRLKQHTKYEWPPYDPEPNPPPWKFSAYVPDLNSKGYSNLAQTRFQTSTFLSFVMQFLGKVLLTIKVFIVFWMFSKGLLSNITTESPKILRMFPQKFCPPPKKSQKILPKKFSYV